MNLMRAGHVSIPGLDANACQGATVVHVFDTPPIEADQPYEPTRVNVVVYDPFSAGISFLADLPVAPPTTEGRTFHLCGDCPTQR